jgi:flagellar basal body rod protein FlgC
MSFVSSIALSGMNAAQTQLGNAAHNLANINTAGFKRQEVNTSTQSSGGVLALVSKTSVPDSAPEVDMVSQLQAKNAFLANLAVFKIQDKMAGALLNQHA